MTYVITAPCIDVRDKTCAGECPAGCTTKASGWFTSTPGECAGCGACEPVCPAGAIFCEDDVPGQWAQFTTENVRFLRPARIARRSLQNRRAAR